MSKAQATNASGGGKSNNKNHAPRGSWWEKEMEEWKKVKGAEKEDIVSIALELGWKRVPQTWDDLNHLAVRPSKEDLERAKKHPEAVEGDLDEFPVKFSFYADAGSWYESRHYYIFDKNGRYKFHDNWDYSRDSSGGQEDFGIWRILKDGSIVALTARATEFVAWQGNAEHTSPKLVYFTFERPYDQVRNNRKDDYLGAGYEETKTSGEKLPHSSGDNKPFHLCFPHLNSQEMRDHRWNERKPAMWIRMKGKGKTNEAMNIWQIMVITGQFLH